MAVLIAIVLLQSQFYREGDWVTYSEFREVSAISYDVRYVYFGSAGGIARYDKSLDRWVEPISVSDGLISNEILVCGYDTYSDCLWIVTPQGIQRYNPSVGNSDVFPAVKQSVLWIHSIGIGEEAVWFASDREVIQFRREDEAWIWQVRAPSDVVWWGRKSLAALDSSRYAFLSPYYFMDNDFVRYEITAVARGDRYLWVGTDGYGAWRYDFFTFQGEHLLYGPAKKRVDCIAIDGDNLWMGGMEGESRGITLWDRKNEEFRYFDSFHISGLNSENVYAIEVAGDFVGFGTDEGVSLYNKKNDGWRTYTIFEGLRSNDVISLERDSCYLFCGTDYGLGVLDTRSRDLEFAPQLGDLRINDVVGSGDTILFATESGVFFIDKRDTSWKQLSSPDNSLEFGTTRIAVDSCGFWFGTYDGVVSYQREDGVWDRWTVADHVHIGKVLALAVDDSNVWVGTRRGVLRFSRSKGRWSAYTTQDGLPDPVILSILLDGDYVWFGSSQGLTRFHWKSPLISD